MLASLLGLLITAFSQALLSLSFAVVSENPGVFWTWLLTGSVFTVGYLAWNAMAFALLPSLSRRLQGSFMDEDLV